MYSAMTNNFNIKLKKKFSQVSLGNFMTDEYLVRRFSCDEFGKSGESPQTQRRKSSVISVKIVEKL